MCQDWELEPLKSSVSAEMSVVSQVGSTMGLHLMLDATSKQDMRKESDTPDRVYLDSKELLIRSDIYVVTPSSRKELVNYDLYRERKE